MVERSVAVAVRRANSGLVVLFSNHDGSCAATQRSINLDLVHRSKHLTYVHDALKDDEEQNVAMHHMWMTAWLDHVLGSEEVTTTAKLVLALQAADFLADQCSVDTICDVLASQLMGSSNIFRSPGGCITLPPWVAVVNALQELPEQLSLRILRAALTVNSTAELFRSILANYNHPNADQSPKSFAVACLINRLPEDLWTLALTAASPSLDAGAICLDDLYNEAACYVIIAAAKVPHLTSLSLNVPLRNPQAPFHHGKRVRCGTPDMHEATATLSSLSSLISLQLTGKHAPRCYQALPSLPLLTSLSLQGQSVPLRSPDNMWEYLGSLKMLRTLDVADCGLNYHKQGSQQDNEQFLWFVGCLNHLTALQELVMRRNDIGSDGWAVLAPTVANLPLQALDLSNCWYISQSIDLHSSACSALTSLCMGGVFGHCDGVLGRELCLCTRLKKLHIVCSKTAEQFWRTLGNAPLVLESFGCTHCDPFASDVLLQFVAKQTGLQRLDITSSNSFDNERHCLSGGPLGDALACLTTLQELRLGSSEMPVAACSRLTALTCLHFDFLQLGSGDGEQLVAAVAQLSGLQELKASCVAGDNAAHSAFGVAIGSLTELSQLTLGHPVGANIDDAAEAYACGARKLCKLKWLRLETSKSVAIKYEMTPWAREMAGMTQLEILQVQGVYLGEGTEMLVEALSKMPVLQRVELYFNSKSYYRCEEVAAKIAPALPRSVVVVTLQV